MIKTIFFSAFLLFAFSKTYCQSEPDQSAHSVIKFKELTYDFGTRTKGSDVSHKFEFQNISKERICIREVKTSCGCTTPKFSSTPVKPGKKGVISAKYDSNRGGPFVKTVTAMVSDGEEVVLTIKGTIKDPDVGAALPK